jgi:Antitoxin VbhA
MKHVATTIHEQELERLTVPAETVADLRRVARGEIDTDEVRRNIMRRLEKS